MSNVSRTQLEIFWKYRGDEDAFSRVASAAERDIMDGISWPLLSDIIQRVRLVVSGKASDTFRTELNALLKQVVDDVSIEELASLIVSGRI